MDPRIEAIHHFWFGDPPYVQRPEWFVKDASFDERIRERFSDAVNEALAGGLRAWMHAPRGSLARVLLLDQFQRNLFRNSARAFAGDALAHEAARQMVDSGTDQQLAPHERVFVYLPFEHAEDLAAQDESVRLFASLREHGDAFAQYYDYALRHQRVIARFGRFPHRNAALDRAPTAEESAYLAAGGDAF